MKPRQTHSTSQKKPGLRFHSRFPIEKYFSAFRGSAPWGDDNIKKVSQDLFDFLEAVALDDDDVAKAVDRAATSRIDQYKRSNPFYTRLDHVPGSQLKDDIIGFVVLTAQAHITGKRRRAFEALCENSSNPEAMLARLEAIASISVQPEVKSRLRPWMQQWREREGPTGRRMPVKLPKIENENSVGAKEV